MSTTWCTFAILKTARLEYFRQLGWFEFEKETGIGPILASTQARFRRPLTYPDNISIAARAVDLAEDRFTLEHIIVSEAQQTIATEGSGLIVIYHYGEKRKMPMPAELRKRIEKLEQTARRNSHELVVVWLSFVASSVQISVVGT